MALSASARLQRTLCVNALLWLGSASCCLVQEQLWHSACQGEGLQPSSSLCVQERFFFAQLLIGAGVHILLCGAKPECFGVAVPCAPPGVTEPIPVFSHPHWSRGLLMEKSF